MKKPRKPKLSKYPKLPKKTASLSSQLNYKRRCDDIDKRNSEKIKLYNQKTQDIKKAHQLYEANHRRKTGGGKVKHSYLKVA